MTLIEFALLLSTAGISGYGFAALCGALLERIGQPVAQPIVVSDNRRR
jgi:hypothetical protein